MAETATPALDNAEPRNSRSRGAESATLTLDNASGDPVVTVPDVVGAPLHDAIAAVEGAGLRVVDDGVPEGDPVDDAAAVRAQEPGAGTRVPLGGCVGFRTAT